MPSFPQRVVQPYRLLLMAVFLIGMAHLIVLPPWEGFDETAHWSSISHIAHKHTLPVYGRDKLARAVDTYPGPLPYAAAPPFEANGGFTYRDFKPAPGTGPRHAGPPPTHEEGTVPNWQAQHPPLYYLLMAPLFHLALPLDWVNHFLVLRTASWLMAFSGLLIGVEATRRLAPEWGPAAVPVIAAWPFLFPQFFPEMARIGNDSLCLLLFGSIWAAFLGLERSHTSQRAALAGLLLGLGLLTKAFFLPLTVGAALYCGWRAWQERSWSWIRLGLIVVIVAFTIGGGWYVYTFIAYGSLTGSDEFIRFFQNPGSSSTDIGRFSAAMARGIAAIAATFAWAGTWSLARPPEWLIAGPVLLAALLTVRWAWQLHRLSPELVLPAFFAAPMVAGLLYHLLMRVAVSGGGTGTPGWYLHILAPALGAAVATGWRGSRLAPVLAVYSGLL